MTPLTAFVPFVAPLVPTVPEPVAVSAIRRACMELLDRSHIWVHDCDPISVTANEPEYDLDVPTGTRVASVRSVGFQGLKVRQRSHDELDKLFPFVDWLTLSGQPTYYTQWDNNIVRLVPMPQANAIDALKVRVALSLLHTATSVNDQIYANYAQGIAYGAAAILLREQEREYSNSNQSTHFHKLFQQTVTEATMQANRSLSRGPLRVHNTRI